MTTLKTGMRVRRTGCPGWGVGKALRVAKAPGLDGRTWATFKFGDWTFESPTEGFEPA